MFDDLRESAISSYEEEIKPVEESPPVKVEKPKKPLLGMTPAQRFVVVLILFFMTCLLGSICLLVTEKIYLPAFW